MGPRAIGLATDRRDRSSDAFERSARTAPGRDSSPEPDSARGQRSPCRQSTDPPDTPQVRRWRWQAQCCRHSGSAATARQRAPPKAAVRAPSERPSRKSAGVLHTVAYLDSVTLRRNSWSPLPRRDQMNQPRATPWAVWLCPFGRKSSQNIRLIITGSYANLVMVSDTVQLCRSLSECRAECVRVRHRAVHSPTTAQHTHIPGFR